MPKYRKTGHSDLPYDAMRILAVLGTMGGVSSMPGTNLPATPTGLTATAVSSTQINLAWSSTGDYTVAFVIERSLDGASFVQIATVPVTQTSYSDTGLTPETRYWYRVKAVN